MIILTEEQAEKVKGVSPLKPGHAIDPIPLKDGTYMLGEEVLLDPIHADIKDYLASLPRIDFKDITNKFLEEEPLPDKTKWEDIGVRVTKGE